MASAGRILIMPKGNYNPSVTYEMLDLVFNGGASWIAKKTVTGIEPSEASAEYWMKMCEGTDLTEVNARIAALENQLVNVASLDDIDLSGYALKSELSNYATNDAVSEVNNGLEALGKEVDTLSQKTSLLEGGLDGIPSSFAKVKVLTHTGNGTYGQSNPCSVTCEDFVPRVLLYVGFHQNYQDTGTILQQSALARGCYYTENVILCDFLTTSWRGGIGFKETSTNDPTTRYAKKSEDGKTIYWCVSDGNDGGIIGDDSKQLNANTRTYYIIALG